jgi:beta-phosphoglucomutase-like phosphatase (HAD superfamily)
VGVRAALAAGCRCVAVTSTVAGTELATANIVVDSLADIPFARVEALALARENG